MRRSCTCLHRNAEATGRRFNLGRNRLMIAMALDFAHVQRLERDENKSAIARAVASGIGIHVFYGGVRFNDFDQSA